MVKASYGLTIQDVSGFIIQVAPGLESIRNCRVILRFKAWGLKGFRLFGRFAVRALGLI
jgi:hypothetical protein